MYCYIQLLWCSLVNYNNFVKHLFFVWYVLYVILRIWSIHTALKDKLLAWEVEYDPNYYFRVSTE